MAAIPDFTDAEIAAVRGVLVRCCRRDVLIHLAQSEFSLEDDGTVGCPTVYWHERGANFIVFKCAADRYRARFFYTPHEHFGSEIGEFDHPGECVRAVLRAQAEHERASERDAESRRATARTHP